MTWTGTFGLRCSHNWSLTFSANCSSRARRLRSSGTAVVVRNIPSGGFQVSEHPFHQLVIEIVAAQQMVPVESLHSDNALAALQDGDVEGSAADTVGQHTQRVARIGTGVRQGRGHRFHHHLLGQGHVEPRSLRSLAGFCDLVGIEIGGVRNHRTAYRLAHARSA